MSENVSPRPMRHVTAALLFLWLAFVARGLWYSALLPAWEGYDEPFHFAALQNVASGRGMPRADTLVSLEVQNSLHLLPLPWELQFQSIPQPLTTHDDFWKLPPAVRNQRMDAVRALDPQQGSQPATEPIQNYESQQAPFYYWLAGVAMGWMRALPLVSRLYLLRMLNVLLASAVVPLAWWIARRVLRSDLQAIGVVAIIVLLPELMINVARVGNEGLALVLFTAMLAAAVNVSQRPLQWRGWLLLGIALGCGLLTKAYFLTAVPAVFAVAAISLWSRNSAPAQRPSVTSIAARLSSSLAVAILIAGRWYADVHGATGSWSGLREDAALRQVSLWTKLAAVAHVKWKSGILSVLISHVWFGGWSFLRVPVAMYLLAFGLIALAMTGVAVRLLRRRTPEVEGPEIMVLTAFYACFWAGLAYDVVILYLIHGVSATTGWYLYALVAAEIVLLVWGLEAFFPARVVLPLLTIAVAGLDLYGMHTLLVPYYTGLTFHRGDSVSPALAATIKQVPEVFARLSETRPAWLGAPVLVAWWLGYWAATIGTLAMVLILSRKHRAGAR